MAGKTALKKRKTKELPVLEEDEDGWPVLPEEPLESESLEEMKDLIRAFVTAHYSEFRFFMPANAELWP